MNGRERVRRTIAFRKPDRVPIYQQYLPRAFLIHGENLLKVLCKYPHDFGSHFDLVFSGDQIEISHFIKERLSARQGWYTDSWGSVWRESIPALQGQVVKPVLSNWADLESFDIPSIPFKDEKEFEEERRKVKQKKKEGYYTVGAYDQRYSNFRGGFTLFQRLCWLRGMENLFKDIVKNREELRVLTNRLMQYLSKAIRRVLQLGVDGIFFADDWGTQGTLLINPDFWRSFFKPRYHQLFDIVHKNDAHVFFHSDGHILEIIPDLIELGVDVLNPQFSCMNLDKLSKIVKGKICILSDIDRQYLLPFGSPRQVKQYVKRTIDLFCLPTGGLIGKGEVGPDVPLPNVNAMFKAFVENGELDY